MLLLSNKLKELLLYCCMVVALKTPFPSFHPPYFSDHFLGTQVAYFWYELHSLTCVMKNIQPKSVSAPHEQKQPEQMQDL